MLCQKNKLNIKNDCGNDVVPHPPRWQFQAFHGALSEPSTLLPGLASGLSGSAGSWDADSKFFHYQVNQIYSMWDCPNIKVLFDVIWTTMHTCWSYKYESSTIFWTVMTENLTRHSLWVFFRCPASPQHSWRCWWLPECRWLLEAHQAAEGLHWIVWTFGSGQTQITSGEP